MGPHNDSLQTTTKSVVKILCARYYLLGNGLILTIHILFYF